MWSPQTSPGGSCSKRDSVSGKEYPLTIDDIGCTISYTVTPVRHDGLTGEPVSLQVTICRFFFVCPNTPRRRASTLLALSVDFSFVDVFIQNVPCLGWLVSSCCCFVLQADPSKVVMSLPPVGVSLELPSTAKECDILEPVTVYQGGKEGASEFRWLRDGEQISSSKSVVPCCSSQYLSPTKSCDPMSFSLQKILPFPPVVPRVHEVGPEDVSHELTLIWTPVRSDGERGQPLEHTITVCLFSSSSPGCHSSDYLDLLPPSPS